MRTTPVFAALALALAPTLLAADAGGIERELTRIESSRRDAIKGRDFATLEKIYAPDFVAIAGNGQVIDRARLFAVFEQTDPSLTFTTDEIRVKSAGDTAVFMGRLVARNTAGTTVFQSRFSHVFVRTGGRWICIAGQSTPIAAQ